MRIALICPHIFMQDIFLNKVIFSPGHLAISLANGLVENGNEVTLFSPGPVATKAHNETVSLELLNEELTMRNYDVMTLMKKHPLLFSTLSRQLQTELLTKAFRMANDNQLDIVHVYMNEEELGLVMSDLCTKPVVFTHHEPMNFLTRYRSIFPKYKHKNWISISYAQRKSMPKNTNWIGNVYHGYTQRSVTSNSLTDTSPFIQRSEHIAQDYLAYFGRIIEPKGVHLAIHAVKEYNRKRKVDISIPITLKIAGKHYADSEKKSYWHTHIEPFIDGEEIQYIGFISDEHQKQAFLAQAVALIMPSTWEEPFGMVMIEALASGTPVIGLDSGAIPEVVADGKTGIIVKKEITKKQKINELQSLDTSELSEEGMIYELCTAIENITKINRNVCKAEYKNRFTVERMVNEYEKIYKRMIAKVTRI